jgi:hypothetical protein
VRLQNDRPCSVPGGGDVRVSQLRMDNGSTELLAYLLVNTQLWSAP